MAKVAVLPQFAYSGLDVGTDFELSSNAAEAAARVPSMVQRMAIANPLGPPPDGLLL